MFTMQFFSQNKNSFPIIIVFRSLLYILIVNSTYSQEIFQSKTIISQPGTQYSPVQPSVQLISTSIQSSFKSCSIACNKNILCRVFDYGVNQPQQCRLFEGDTHTLGSIISSPSSSSMVGTINLSPGLFAAYGQSCASSPCPQSRYLQCGSNQTCQCMPHTYWNSSKAICVPQSPILGAACQLGMNMCREDLNYTCLQFYQCGPLSILSGITIADNNTAFYANSTIGVNTPTQMALMELSGESLLVPDAGRNRVLRFINIGSNYYNVSIVAQNWSGGNSLTFPLSVFVDETHGNNLYVSDCANQRIVLFTAMQNISPLPKIVVSSTFGSALNQLYNPYGITVDNASNVIISDTYNHRIMLWAPNAESGIKIAGSNGNGSDAQSLNTPYDLFIDQKNSWLYVADTMNNRIQRFSLYGNSPKNGTTVAGGNGPGSSSNQLKIPVSLWISTKTGNIYIADQYNNRIQRWKPNATEGVTIAGSPLGLSGSTPTLLLTPNGLVVNANETFMYVSDVGNRRIQKFQLL